MEDAGDAFSSNMSYLRQSSPSAASTEEKDIISSLPDDILLRVLSFLEVKDVVMTSVLSRRWSSLWTETTSVSADIRTVNRHKKDEITFFDRFLFRCTSPVIRKLHLNNLMNDSWLNERINVYIRFAVGRHVEDLLIEVDEWYDDHPHVLPLELLQCKSLTRLGLLSCAFPSLSNDNLRMISWSSLKVLTLHRMMMVDEVINGVLERSPLLESLTLDRCYDMDSIRISSKVMRELIINSYRDPYNENHCRRNVCLEIYAPYLRSLQLLGLWRGKEAILLKEFSSLVDVVLDFSFGFDKTNSDIIYGSMKGILSKLSFVDKIMFGNEILMDLCSYKGNGEFSLQLRCRHLTAANISDEYCLGRIAKVLERAPNVEKLTIDFTNPKTYTKLVPTNADAFCNNFECWKRLTCCIKNIAIIGFPVCNGDEQPYWLSLVKLLLRDSQALDKMVIHAIQPWFQLTRSSEEAYAEYVSNVEEDILLSPRGSKAAEEISGQKDPSCNNESLKTGRIKRIAITGFPVFLGPSGANQSYWLSLIKVLLRDAQVLEKMDIEFWRYHDRCVIRESHLQQLLKVSEAIQGYPRASKAARSC